MNYLKEYLESLLEEKPVGDKNKELWLDYLKKKYSDKDVKNLFVSFVSEDKIGINPKSKYKTPNGIYTYPMEFLLKDNEVPFRGSNKPKKIKIIKAVSEKVLDKTLTKNNYYKSVDILLNKYKDKYDFNLEEYINDFNDNNKELTNYKKLWTLTYKLANTPNDWSKMLITIGFDWSNDDGEGIIHTSEPTQAVFLNPSSYKLIDEEFVDTEERYKETNKNVIYYEKLKAILKNKTDDNLYGVLYENMKEIKTMIKLEFLKDKESKTLNYVLLKLDDVKNHLANDIIYKLTDVIEIGLPLDYKILNQIPTNMFQIFLKRFSFVIDRLVYQDLKNDYVKECITSLLVNKLEQLDFVKIFQLIFIKLLKENHIKWIKYYYINEDLQIYIIDSLKVFFLNMMKTNPKLFVKSVYEDTAKHCIKIWKTSLTDKEQELLQDLL